jgi:hypothetical protein
MMKRDLPNQGYLWPELKPAGRVRRKRARKSDGRADSPAPPAESGDESAGQRRRKKGESNGDG